MIIIIIINISIGVDGGGVIRVHPPPQATTSAVLLQGPGAEGGQNPKP